MERINDNDMFRKMQEIFARLNAGCDIAYMEEKMQFVISIGKEYNVDRGSFSSEVKKIQLDRYIFFTNFLLKYIAKKYNIQFDYDVFSNYENSCYMPSDNSINLSKKIAGKLEFEHIVFIIFHEFRHCMQHYDLNNNSIDSLLRIDPGTIIFLKEKATQNDENLYQENHDCFYKENDANLFALSECKRFFDTSKFKEFFDTSRFKKLYGNELINYISAMVHGTDLLDKMYHTKQQLPIIYEEDYRCKKLVLGKYIKENSLLGLIYKSDGTPKTFEELMLDKVKLLEKFKGQIITHETSTTDYVKWSSVKTAAQHIEEIYKLIIASDPLLTIQEYLYKLNSIKNKRQVIDNIKYLLYECPQLIDVYFDDIMELFTKEILKGNDEFIKMIVNDLPNDKFVGYANARIKILKTKPVSKVLRDTSTTTEYENDKEKVPYPSEIKSSEYKQTISQSVKKSDMIQGEKQKLHEIKQQVLNYQIQQSMNQDSDFEDEDSHGMSM